MKKVLSLILVFTMLSISLISFAGENASNSKIEEPFFSENEAADIALLFVLKNMCDENNWNTDTIINKVYNLYNLEKRIVGYTFNLSTEGTFSGYITVSAEEDKMPIQEFSFSDKSLFEEKFDKETLLKIKENKNKIIYNGPLEYYMFEEDSYYDIEKNKIKDVEKIIKEKKDKNIEISKKNNALKKLLKESQKIFMGADYDGQVSGYVIDDRIAYMSDRYGSYSYESGSYLSGYDGLDMDDYGGAKDCSLVSITTMANWYYDDGYTNIPSTPSDIYDDVLVEGLANGYTTSGGTDPTKIDNIIEDSFAEWGYSVNASNIYVWSYSTFTGEINNDRPLMYNLATGYYSEHSISVFGYKNYDVADFLMVKDNWTTSTRYIHWQQMINEIGSVTKMQMN